MRVKIKESRGTVAELWGLTGEAIDVRKTQTLEGYEHTAKTQYRVKLDKPLRKVGPGICGVVWMERHYFDEI